MHRRLQFGMRENPASDRRHDSRQAVCSVLAASSVEKKPPTSARLVTGRNDSLANEVVRLRALGPSWSMPFLSGKRRF